MSNISFNGIGSVIATFAADPSTKVGDAVQIKENSAIAPCVSGEKFIGIVQSVRAGFAAVLVRGFVTMPQSDITDLGPNTLIAGSSSSLKYDANGTPVTVVNITGTHVTFLL